MVGLPLSKNLIIVMLIKLVISFVPKKSLVSLHRKHSSATFLTSSPTSPPVEYIFSNSPEDSAFSRNNLIHVTTSSFPTKRVWARFSSELQLDCVDLPDYFISGKRPLTLAETIAKWNTLLNNRIYAVNDNPLTSHRHMTPSASTFTSPLADELREALSITTLSSYVSRSLQTSLLKLGFISKHDSTPVTIADFTVQALVIDHLHRRFPNDRFIAEEDSKMLRVAESREACDRILRILEHATADAWSRERLFAALDNGRSPLCSIATGHQ
jgi:hypothetical protein